jgi:hypothetical protein
MVRYGTNLANYPNFTATNKPNVLGAGAALRAEYAGSCGQGGSGGAVCGGGADVSWKPQGGRERDVCVASLN